ncbi:MAG: GumC family protein [Acidobacteriota bacterium]
MSFDPQPELQTGEPVQSRVTPMLSEERRNLMDVWRVLMKRRFVILAVTVVCFIATAVYVFRTDPVYQSIAEVEIEPNSSPNLGIQSLIGQQYGSDDESMALQTELRVLQSDSVLFHTAQSLHLIDRIRANAQKENEKGGMEPSGLITPSEHKEMIRFIRDGLRVSILPNTEIVEIQYRNTDAKLATAIVNKLVKTYSDEELRLKYERTMHVSEWLQSQLGGLRHQASDAQRLLADYQKSHNIVGTDENSNLTLETLSEISSDLESAEADRIMKEARMREFDSLNPDLQTLMGDNPTLSSLLTQLNNLQSQRAELATRLGPNHPKMRQLKLEIDRIQAQVKNQVQLAKLQVQAEYQGALRAENALRRRLVDQEDAAYRLNEDVAQYAILRHEAELNRDLYDTLQMRLKEASVTAGLSAANITVIDSADVPLAPVAPRKGLDMGSGLLGGLLCGCVLAFMIESIDDRLQTSEEVETVTTLPSLAAIPHMAQDLAKRRSEEKKLTASNSSVARTTFAALLDSTSLSAEAYRGMRSSLLLSSIDNPPRVIVVTSAFPGEGKTTTAVNCAIVLAQRGERVLLVDADLRRGSLYRMFALSCGSFGLSSVLAQPDSRRDWSIPLPELPTLHVLPTGPRPPNPAEMLSSNRMEEQLRQWAQEFDRIVLDTAPLLAVSDTQALAAVADTVVLVARAGMTRKRALVRARDLLWRINAPVTGVVMNDVDMRLENFYTYRYGMYGYQYGYQYSSPDSEANRDYQKNGKGD